MFKKEIQEVDKRMTELYKYVVNETAKRDKLNDDIDIQLSKIHQFNAEVRPAIKDALDRVKKLEQIVKELETDEPKCDEEEYELIDYIDSVYEKVFALARYLKVEFKDEGLKAIKK